MKPIFYLLAGILLSAYLDCAGQPVNNKEVGGPCEGCEAIYEYGSRILTNTDSLPGFMQYSPALKLYGTVYQQDGVTPANGVIIYIYHTNQEGIYQAEPQAAGWAQRHGKFRGWVQTGRNGQYAFYTFRPGAYPSRRTPEHIHMTVKEPNLNEYYIDEILFEDDVLLEDEFKSTQRKRGGSGIVTPIEKEGLLLVKRDIILGQNIPNYY